MLLLRTAEIITPQRLVPLGTLAIIALVALYVPRMASFDNISLVLRQVAVPAIVAIGVTFVIIAGRLDLTVGSLLSLCAVTVVTLHDMIDPMTAMIITLGVGLVSGCVTGVLVAYLNLNSLITTLGMMSFLQGVTLVYTNGKNAQIAHPDATWFAFIGRGYLSSVPVPIVTVAVLIAIMGTVLSRTTFGRRIFAVGGNEIASVYSSINAKRTILVAYIISGLMTAIAAIVFGSRVMDGRNDSGAGYELFVLSGVVLGGTSLLGGSGGVGRSVFGIVILGLIQNALLLLGLPYYYQWIVTWVVIVLAVWADTAAKRGKVFW
jgi:ribose transport system permease protein